MKAPLRKITATTYETETLECGHTQKRRPKYAERRRCIQCRRAAAITVAERHVVTEGQRCPFCFDSFDNPEETTWRCNKCQTLMHAECFEELLKCPTLGCGQTGQVSPGVQLTIRPVVKIKIPERTAWQRFSARVACMFGSVVGAVDRFFCWCFDMPR